MKRAYKAGVKFALGSDAGVVPHGQGARELEWLVKVGLSPAEALVVATLNTANMMGLGGEIGSLEVGKSADVIAVADNPLADITALRKVNFVMRAGVIYRRETD
jgi:imidazolonepropionase-like amidohydrolase